MAASAGYRRRRDKDGLGVWEHRGKVAVVGIGHSPVDRRWDEVSMDQMLAVYSMQHAAIHARGLCQAEAVRRAVSLASRRG
jgi:hypothetical protein